ncbi:hypothetical protein BST81_04080 [Leptolyngbya sp. 'hensonii']|uniref:nuclear transport factor 2 family protein n=1 Tax=Leptolyngbya sp. 'hensonii' TaxID=1922337 RepID=UPI00094F797E|nr:nuclear transport factor 2 family protein [Leptolyngbya sp. 'hensonii']OLP19723.1 hypothetical protein BST81_04080 [Leptolyngbya sp. 'hensonii']
MQIQYFSAASQVNWARSLFLTLALTAGGFGWQADRARAASPDTAPVPIKAALTQIDAAANNRDLQTVLQFYSENFTNTDGLTRQSLADALTALWKRYPKLTYRTEIKSWKADGNGFMVETVTTITGIQRADGKEMALTATLRAQQRVEGNKIVRQEILAERSQLTSGAKPPTVQIILPEQVTVGQAYNFDAIVKEPLGDGVLLGTAIEEPVRASNYLVTSPAELEILSAGGIYKTGRAPNTPESRWISAVLVREDGMVIITQRLRVVPK